MPRNQKLLGVVIATMAALIASSATAYADPVPTTDEVVAVLARLTDPGITAANKADIVTPGFAPDEAGTIDDHLNRMNAFGGLLPPNFVVTDIQPAPNNFAGATVATTGGYKHATNPRPIVLVNQGGHWQITHDTAMTVLDALWTAAQWNPPHWVPICALTTGTLYADPGIGRPSATKHSTHQARRWIGPPAKSSAMS